MNNALSVTSVAMDSALRATSLSVKENRRGPLRAVSLADLCSMLSVNDAREFDSRHRECVSRTLCPVDFYLMNLLHYE